MKEFKNFAQFAEYLIQLQAKEKIFKISMLEESGQLVEDEAKRMFGVYQDAKGNFPAWEPLADSTMEQRVKKGFEPNNPLYMTGDLMHSITHKVELDSVVIGSDSQIMVYQEDGTANIPPRPVLGPAMFQSKDKILQIIRLGMMSWLSGKVKK